MSGCKIVQLVGGPFHGDTTELGEGKPLVMFDQTSCMEGAKYTLDPEQCAYIYEGTPSTEEAASLLHWFEPFLKEYEDAAVRQGQASEADETGELLGQGPEGQDEVPPESQSEVQATLW
tara:strand:- start:210 stop:566 length:357 start_codon:yes stop_codon:yes gene_type:complete